MKSKIIADILVSLQSNRFKNKDTMIIGRTHSTDGGFRRIPVRHTQIVDEETRFLILTYLYDKVKEVCSESDWVGLRDIYPIIQDDIIGTPLEIVYNKCKHKFGNDNNAVNINLAKYVGMLIREAVYTSSDKYYEIIDGTVRKYSLASKGLKNESYFKNRKLAIEGKYGREE